MSFYNPYDVDYTYEKWIRKPENIIVAHETCKKIGYEKLLGFVSNDYIWFLDVNKPANELIDSLIITYQNRYSKVKILLWILGKTNKRAKR